MKEAEAKRDTKSITVELTNGRKRGNPSKEKTDARAR